MKSITISSIWLLIFSISLSTEFVHANDCTSRLSECMSYCPPVEYEYGIKVHRNCPLDCQSQYETCQMMEKQRENFFNRREEEKKWNEINGDNFNPSNKINEPSAIRQEQKESGYDNESESIIGSNPKSEDSKEIRIEKDEDGNTVITNTQYNQRSSE